MERKGLSQILYLIIAASVLMMIAMVITFTATDTIGGLGGSASETACMDSLQGKCTGSPTRYVTLPKAQCVSQGQYVGSLTDNSVYTRSGGSFSSGVSAADVSSSSATDRYYVDCQSNLFR